MDLKLILYVLLAHWIADFVFQSRWMGENKSKDFIPLFAHIATYTVVLWVFCLFQAATPEIAFLFAVLNGLAHLLTDWITSNITSYAFKEKKMHLFWCTIGFDQYMHVAVLLSTLHMLQ